jgi:hypothetical protein
VQVFLSKNSVRAVLFLSSLNRIFISLIKLIFTKSLSQCARHLHHLSLSTSSLSVPDEGHTRLLSRHTKKYLRKKLTSELTITIRVFGYAYMGSLAAGMRWPGSCACLFARMQVARSACTGAVTSSREAFARHPSIHVKPPYLRKQARARPVAHAQVSNQVE